MQRVDGENLAKPDYAIFRWSGCHSLGFPFRIMTIKEPELGFQSGGVAGSGLGKQRHDRVIGVAPA